MPLGSKVDWAQTTKYWESLGRFGQRIGGSSSSPQKGEIIATYSIGQMILMDTVVVTRRLNIEQLGKSSILWRHMMQLFPSYPLTKAAKESLAGSLRQNACPNSRKEKNRGEGWRLNRVRGDYPCGCGSRSSLHRFKHVLKVQCKHCLGVCYPFFDKTFSTLCFLS